MKVLSLDCETTTFKKGNPFSRRNKLCTVGLYNGDDGSVFDIEYSSTPYGKYLSAIKEKIEETDLLIGFNLKFDLHWIKRYVDIRIPNVWDTQLAEFIIGNQNSPYPSLNDGLSRNGIPTKLDRVRDEFWDRGIDTPEIPWDILSEYQLDDVVKTYQLYLKQKEEFEAGDPRLYELFKLQCKDLIVLEEAEYHGLRLDVATSLRNASELRDRIVLLNTELRRLSDERINFSSSDHVSVLLYGGRLTVKVREQYSRQLKSGEVKVRERWGIEEVEFPRLVNPVERSESSITSGMSERDLEYENEQRASAGRRPLQRLYSVDEATLRSLRGKGKVKRIIEALLELSELEKLEGTYYRGLPAKIEEMDWPDGEMHGQFNQCVVITSRLSSKEPNLQNLAGVTKSLYISRFD